MQLAKKLARYQNLIFNGFMAPGIFEHLPTPHLRIFLTSFSYAGVSYVSGEQMSMDLQHETCAGPWEACPTKLSGSSDGIVRLSAARSTSLERKGDKIKHFGKGG